MDTIKFSIPGKPEYLTMVRLGISSIANTAGFDVESIDDLKHAVTSACKHVSCYKSECYSDEYEVTCSVDQGFMEITVKDICDTHSIEKTKKQCKQCPTECDLGFFVIDTLMNDVEYFTDQAGHKVIKMVKRV